MGCAKTFFYRVAARIKREELHLRSGANYDTSIQAYNGFKLNDRRAAFQCMDRVRDDDRPLDETKGARGKWAIDCGPMALVSPFMPDGTKGPEPLTKEEERRRARETQEQTIARYERVQKMFIRRLFMLPAGNETFDGVYKSMQDHTVSGKDKYDKMYSKPTDSGVTCFDGFIDFDTTMIFAWMTGHDGGLPVASVLTLWVRRGELWV
ncbi:hypothetical protein MRB53_039153 [Persea americana]|nr:hypothetical protein MRB53_039153 [Persea americana]